MGEGGSVKEELQVCEGKENEKKVFRTAYNGTVMESLKISNLCL